MNNRYVVAIAALATFISGCGLTPRHHLTRGVGTSSILLIDAPAGSVLQVGDLSAGTGEDGEARLAVGDGWHEVRVVSRGREIHSERIFVQDGSRRVIDLKP